MKSLVTIILSLTLIGTTSAQTHTVNNDPNAGAQFTTIQDAVNAAANGDTILVAGSETTYPSFTLNKSLTIIGPGYLPDESEQFGFSALVGGMSIENQSEALQTNGSDSWIEGLIFTSPVGLGVTTQDTLENVTLTKNEFRGRINFNDCYNIFIYNNLISSDIYGNFGNGSNNIKENIFIQNNIFTTGSTPIDYFYTSKIVISNNLFISNSSTSDIFLGNRFITFTNNIVYGLRPGINRDDCDFCTITNNIVTNANVVTFDYGTNSTANNLENVNPGFVNAPDFIFDFTDDYTLSPTSPAIGAASDGGDIGIYGGQYPFPGDTSPSPLFPKITDFNIQNGSVPQGGTLDVQFKAKVVGNN